MDAKVAPKYEAASGPKFKKPVPMTPPLTEFDPAYLKRKAELPEQIFKLSSGKQFGYFAEGNPEDPTIVCFASAGFNISSLIPSAPVPGLYVLYVNQMGHGNSSPLTAPIVFSEAVPEVLELVDGLKIDKFYTCGHSCGGVYAMQIAAAHPDRVLGCAVISSPGCLQHPTVSKKELKVIDKIGSAAIGSPGCWGSFVRSMMSGCYYYPDKTKDFGFAGHSAGGYGYYKSKATGGAPKAMESDHYFVSKMLDAELNGANSKNGLVHEMAGVYSNKPWSYDIANIKCKTFLYVESEGEVPQSYMELNQRLIPGSELLVWEAHGHVSIAMEFAGIVVALVQGKSFPGDYGAKGC